MAAINNAQSESPAMKVVVICKPPDDNGTASSDACDTSCLQVENKHISAKRPGSSAAMKQFGPFQLCSSAGAIPLFYDCCAGDIMNALQRGTSYGVITYGGVGNGKTTCMWGSLGGLPAEDAIVPTVCGQLFSIIQATAYSVLIWVVPNAVWQSVSPSSHLNQNAAYYGFDFSYTTAT